MSSSALKYVDRLGYLESPGTNETISLTTPAAIGPCLRPSTHFAPEAVDTSATKRAFTQITTANIVFGYFCNISHHGYMKNMGP